MHLFWRWLRYVWMAIALPYLAGCAAFYVDGHSPEVPVSAYKKPAAPPEVQLIWEFQTKGVANARATQHLKDRVHDQIAASGVFTKVTAEPVSSGALLSVTVNNIPLSDDAFSKGFVAGLTFGLAGQTVGDGYECTVRYVPGQGGGQPLQHVGKHVIYTSIGTGTPPMGAIKTDGVEAAVNTMMRQIISRTLNDLTLNPAFP